MRIKTKAAPQRRREAEARRLARRIANDLFSDGERLVIELPDKRMGGGWCRAAVIDRVAALLCASASWRLCVKRTER